MTREEWEKLHENFDTTELLSAVDAIDELRTHLNDQENFAPPQIRTDLLKLHQLAMAVVNEGSQSQAEEFFTLADDLQSQVYCMLEFMEKIDRTLRTLMALQDLPASAVLMGSSVKSPSPTTRSQTLGKSEASPQPPAAPAA